MRFILFTDRVLDPAISPQAFQRTVQATEHASNATYNAKIALLYASIGICAAILQATSPALPPDVTTTLGVTAALGVAYRGAACISEFIQHKQKMPEILPNGTIAYPLEKATSPTKYQETPCTIMPSSTIPAHPLTPLSSSHILTNK